MWTTCCIILKRFQREALNKRETLMVQIYDYLIVGAGLFGCTCAERLKNAGHSVLVIDKNGFIGGACATKKVDGINVHRFGAHIFRTDREEVFSYVNRFSVFNHYINQVIAISHGRAYNLPFNMNTFCQVFQGKVLTPAQAQELIASERLRLDREPRNLEEQALSLVGGTLYHSLIKEYTEKQWGKPCHSLPPDLMRRIPIRFTFDNNYYNARFQGIPIGGYSLMMARMLEGCDVILDTDYLHNKEKWSRRARKIIFTGPIDEYFGYRFGALEYRGLKFVEREYDCSNFQGNAVINWSDKEVPYTRTIEHKFFENATTDKTIVSYEYPMVWKKGDYPFYPINDETNMSLLSKYLELASLEPNVCFGGRLGSYRYFDMQDTIISALDLCEGLL